MILAISISVIVYVERILIAEVVIPALLFSDEVLNDGI